MDPFIGAIAAYPWNWPPLNWSLCEGQLIAVSQNPTLFSLIADRFGGDGRSTFGLPDLRGRSIVGQGTGPGLSNRYLGERWGWEYITLTQNNLPSHTHTLGASSTTSESLTQQPEEGWTLGAAASVSTDRTPVVTAVHMYGPVTQPEPPINSAPTSSVGEGAAIPTTPPSLCLNFCIAMQGIYPSRN